MKFSFSWLKEHLDTELNAIEISEKLTSIGLEVESFNDASLAFRNFIVAEVIEEKKHPNADKLKLCLVDTGKEKVDVVCGAPNVEKGMKVVYAPPGSIIPVNQMKLKVSKIRGVESPGMMCSEYELGISDEVFAEVLGGVSESDNIKIWNKTEPLKRGDVGEQEYKYDN